MLVFAVMTKAILGLVLLSAALTVACGSSGGDSQPTLDGIWQAQLQDSCVGTFEFNGAMFTQNVFCPVGSNGAGDAYEAGTFTATSTTVTFAPTESSCPADDVTGTFAYSLQGSQLVLTLPSTSIILEKMSLGAVAGGAVVQYGCWDISKTPGLFTPGAITQL